MLEYLEMLWSRLNPDRQKRIEDAVKTLQSHGAIVSVYNFLTEI